ncbi:hypothetical protein QYF36_007696 [Acer negundo]|nr:hypothetical protein QYF36_007696 [Acer negundo]
MAANLLCVLLQEEEDDEDGDYASLLAITALEEGEHTNKGQSSHRRGSIPGHAIIQRYRVQGHERLYHDYFDHDYLFQRRFQMHRPLFLNILLVVEAYDSYFVQRQNATGINGLSSLQKMTAAIRMLAYGVSAYSVDDYMRICESTAIESLNRFTKVVVAIFFDEYLRSPNNEDTVRLLVIGNQCGFPGMLGSIDSC